MRRKTFVDCPRHHFLCMLNEQVIIFSLGTSTIWQTKWWLKLKVVSFGRFRLSIMANLFFKNQNFKNGHNTTNHPHFLSCMFNLKKRTESCTQKYPVSSRIIQARFFQLSGKSSIQPDSEKHYPVHP